MDTTKTITMKNLDQFINESLNEAKRRKIVPIEDVKVGMKGSDYGDVKGTVLAKAKAKDWKSLKKYDTSGWLYDGDDFKEFVDIDSDWLVAIKDADGDENVYLYGSEGFAVYE